MQISIGTFNLNNLFSRYNFKGEISAIKNNNTSVDGGILYQFSQDDVFKIRAYQGSLVKTKKELDVSRIAERITDMDLDVLAVQEVEDIDTLKLFNRDHLNGMYPYIALIEGNDPRLIDIGVMSKLPIGGITSWQYASHPDTSGKKVFSRDLLQVQILNNSRTRTLFTLFNTHLKSHFYSYNSNPAVAEANNNSRRKKQAEVIAEIIKSETRPNSRYILVGDMNDPPDSDPLKGFTSDTELSLTNALANPIETRKAKKDTPPPTSASWTHRYKKSGKPAEYELYDQIWLSPSLTSKFSAAFINRRKRHSGDGSDHDPAWVVLDL